MIRFHCSGNDTHIAHHAAINIKHRIKNQRAQCLIRRLSRRRNALHNCLENFLDSSSHLCARLNRFLGRDRKNFLQLAMHGGHICVWQIDLIDNRNNGEPLLVSEMNIRDRLCFHSLCRIDNQKGSLARSKAT